MYRDNESLSLSLSLFFIEEGMAVVGTLAMGVAVDVAEAVAAAMTVAVAVDVINLIHKRYLSLRIVMWFEDSLAVPGNLRQGILREAIPKHAKKTKSDKT